MISYCIWDLGRQRVLNDLRKKKSSNLKSQQTLEFGHFNEKFVIYFKGNLKFKINGLHGVLAFYRFYIWWCLG
jgi:hypothetical protein